MSTMAAFLETIRQNPYEDTPRLVFADWLDEQGDPRGEFIRLQVELANWIPEAQQRIETIQRAEDLLKEHQAEWLEGIPISDSFAITWERGTLSAVTTQVPYQLDNPWLQDLRLNAFRDQDHPLLGIRHADFMKHLHTVRLVGWSRISEVLLEEISTLQIPHVDFSHSIIFPEAMESSLGQPIYPINPLRQSLWRKWLNPSNQLVINGRRRLWHNSIGMPFVEIPAGTFWMGSPETESGHDPDEFLHHVAITKPFYMGMYPVRQCDYLAICQVNPSQFAYSTNGNYVHPVESVSWNDAVEFCRRLTNLPTEQQAGRVYRLPTEAEWEYACRAGTNTRFSFGNEWSLLLANMLHTHSNTLPVGMYPANPFGLFDMHGQVREWCSDWYHREYYHVCPKNNPTGPEDGESKVIRGGSWDVSGEQYCRSAYRVYFHPTNHLSGIGFRVVCEIRK